MTMMELSAQADGRHRIQSRETAWADRPPGWVRVPSRLVPAVRRWGGYCDPVLKDGRLVGMLPAQGAAAEPGTEALAMAGVLTQDAYEVIVLGGTYG